jgi:hypothetical protein
MNQDLLRQRRNLIAISAVLLIFDFAKVKITKVGILGTDLLVGDAHVLMMCAWLLWAYFFLRYYQYWRAEPEQHIRESFKKRLDTYARSYTKARAVQEATSGAVYDDYRISRTGRASWSYTLRQFDPVKGGINDGPTFRLPVWRLALWSLKSAAFVGIQTPHATDHVLPFTLAIAAPVVSLCSGWQ